MTNSTFYVLPKRGEGKFNQNIGLSTSEFGYCFVLVILFWFHTVQIVGQGAHSMESFGALDQGTIQVGIFHICLWG